MPGGAVDFDAGLFEPTGEVRFVDKAGELEEPGMGAKPSAAKETWLPIPMLYLD